MSLHKLRAFWLRGNWTPLFSRLPQWREVSPACWSDDISVVHLVADAFGGPYFGFTETRGRDTSMRVSNCDDQSLSHGRPLVTPSGISIAMVPEPVGGINDRSIIMNHVAWYTTSIDAESTWLSAFLGRQPILERGQAWEPIARAFIADRHFFESDGYYITLRHQESRSGWDHVGWMAASAKVVDDMASIIANLGWEILWGPDGIDGNYLVHFLGPDGRVHDFFWPEPALVEKTKQGGT